VKRLLTFIHQFSITQQRTNVLGRTLLLLTSVDSPAYSKDVRGLLLYMPVIESEAAQLIIESTLGIRNLKLEECHSAAP
jgi:hypothetical protein